MNAASPSRSPSFDDEGRMAKDLPKEGSASTSLSALVEYAEGNAASLAAVSTLLPEVNATSPS